MAQPRLLLVEDDHGTRELLTLSFELEGFEVSGFEDVASALTALPGALPAAVVTDLSLSSDQGGLDLARAIRDAEGFADVRIVALTGWSPDRLPPGDRALFDAIFVKPVEVERIAERIRELYKDALRRLASKTPGAIGET